LDAIIFCIFVADITDLSCVNYNQEAGLPAFAGCADNADNMINHKLEGRA